MQYVMLIYQGTALERQAALPEEEQKQVSAGYQGINQTPGVTPGLPMGLPQNATTVRVEGGKTLTTDGPFAGMKEAVGGLVRPGGRRPRRGDRGGCPRPCSTLWWRRRDPPLGGVLVARLERVFRAEWGRVPATLIGFLGDFDLAEEAAQEAFAIAADRRRTPYRKSAAGTRPCGNGSRRRRIPAVCNRAC